MIILSLMSSTKGLYCLIIPLENVWRAGIGNSMCMWQNYKKIKKLPKWCLRHRFSHIGVFFPAMCRWQFQCAVPAGCCGKVFYGHVPHNVFTISLTQSTNWVWAIGIAIAKMDGIIEPLYLQSINQYNSHLLGSDGIILTICPPGPFHARTRFSFLGTSGCSMEHPACR